MWAWGDKIVVGFTVGYQDPDGGFHTRDRTLPFTTMQARSVDGGLTWQVGETPCRRPGGRALSADEHVEADLRVAPCLDNPGELLDCPGDADFAASDFALMCARSGLADGARSWFYVSADRCPHWDRPYRQPPFGLRGIAARTDYVVSGGSECTLFLTAVKSDGREGPPFCARTTDGGATVEFHAWIGAEPEGYRIMPASVRLPAGRWLVAIRTLGRGTPSGCCVDLFASDDDARSWRLVGRPVENTGAKGNPPTLTRLMDGRLCLTYGFRDPPHQIRARISEDTGASWGDELVVRDKGGGHDMGYPRTTQRADGDLVTVYYFNDAPESER